MSNLANLKNNFLKNFYIGDTALLNSPTTLFALKFFRRQKKFEAPAQIPSGLYGINSAQEGGLWGGGVSAIPAKAGRQNRNIFVSLIENNFGGARIKKCSENFSVLLAEAKRRQAETLGGIQSAKSRRRLKQNCFVILLTARGQKISSP